MKRPFSLFLLALAALLVVERAWWLVRHQGAAEIDGAEWIWAPEAASTSVPVAFYAARDFDLDDGSTDELRFAITAEQEYQLFVNGRFVGGGSWMSGSPVDVYEVGDLLRPGRNRVLVELRSFRGVGGLLGSLFRVGESPLLVTDETWQIVRHHRKGLHEGTAALGDAPPAVSWGEPPTGRWGLVRVAREVSSPFVVPSDPVEPRDRVTWALTKSRSQLCQTLEELEASGARTDGLDLEPEQRHCEPVLVVDFGSERCGFLEVELEGRPQVPYRVWFGRRGEELPERPADELALLVPGSERWRSSHARDFSRVWIVGVGDVRSARLRLRDGAVPPVEPEEDGVWGLEPPEPSPAPTS